jgi:hypothetical protein
VIRPAVSADKTQDACQMPARALTDWQGMILLRRIKSGRHRPLNVSPNLPNN